MPNWRDCLVAYDTVDKCLALARALEVESHIIENSLYGLNENFVSQVNAAPRKVHEFFCKNAGCDLPFEDDDFRVTLKDMEDMSMDSLKIHCYDKILMRRARQEISKLVSGPQSDIKRWFVTVNFDDTVVTDANEVSVINTFISKVYSISGLSDDIQHVAEKYREGGSQIHRHIHFIIKSAYRKSKIIQYIHQKVPKVGKEKTPSVASKSFIDVKPCESYHEKYIKGDKRPEKMDCVRMDQLWRSKNNIR